ncbi:lipopolysaccharide biosynthesis regulator YciM [Scopulibacillus darangshiensis]|uniref:Lipopolysaccharide biosynthesis regulator YciM n=1 Tax=Scopulibacillus darangshiensis TaxID=442528 RepID=A0A4R2PC24_9BACL|nr:tetratricopeptide repeat protein [Scopulibacillus darangshiensis]TCP31631.1 lipopolysaccharide biosynthesis regulator YciM [Scopulibacillus darangshiensis]
MVNDLDTAISLVETGQTEQGLAMVKELLTSADDDTAYKIAVLMQDWGLIEDAEAVFNDLLIKYPEDSDLILQIAELLVDKDEEEKAINLLNSISNYDENYLSAQLLLADLYQMQGLDEVAESKLKTALQMAPDQPILLFALGEFYLSAGYPAEAVPYYKKVLHADVLSHENVEVKLAEALSLNAQFEEALIYYQKGLDKSKTLDGLFGYGMTAMQVGKYQTAISAFVELKELDPGYSTLYPVLAEAYQEEGATNEALVVLEEGMKTDELNERLYNKAGELSWKQKDWDRAKRYYNDLLKINPDNIEAFKRVIEIKINDDDAFDEVIADLEDSQHDDPTLKWYLAKAYMRNDHLDMAESIYKDNIQYFNENPEFLSEYGELLWQLGKREEALLKLNQALSFDPQNQILQGFVERIEQDFS